MNAPEAVLAFWFGDAAADDAAIANRQASLWWGKSSTADATIRREFGVLVEAAARGSLNHWAATDTGLLALVLLIDQFRRNLYRDSAEAFALDDVARGLTRQSLRRGGDRRGSRDGHGRHHARVPSRVVEALARAHRRGRARLSRAGRAPLPRGPRRIRRRPPHRGLRPTPHRARVRDTEGRAAHGPTQPRSTRPRPRPQSHPHSLRPRRVRGGVPAHVRESAGGPAENQILCKASRAFANVCGDASQPWASDR